MTRDRDDRRRVGPWRIDAEKTVYDNPWIRVVDHAVTHPTGASGQYGVVHFKNLAIGVLPIDANGCAPLVGQHRFPHDAYSWELPEGGGPRTVDSLASAKRELREETGYAAAHWLELCRFDVSNSVTDEKAICYAAWGLTPGPAAPEPSEELARDLIPFQQLHERVLSGEISDSLTIIMVLKLAALHKAGRLPAALSDRLRAGEMRHEL